MSLWQQLRLVVLTTLLTGIAGLYLRARESRSHMIGDIDGKIVSAQFAGNAFVSAVSRRFDQVIGVLQFVDQKVVIKYTVPLQAGGPVDSVYLAPSVKEIHRLINLFKDDLEYRSESYDCDDFSRHFKDQLAHQWAKEGNRAPLTIVEVYAAVYILQTKEVVYHAFNAIITDEGKVVFIEPQGPHVVTFSKARIINIYQAVI
jgi:hypothetical protein